MMIGSPFAPIAMQRRRPGAHCSKKARRSSALGLGLDPLRGLGAMRSHREAIRLIWGVPRGKSLFWCLRAFRREPNPHWDARSI